MLRDIEDWIKNDIKISKLETDNEDLELEIVNFENQLASNTNSPNIPQLTRKIERNKREIEKNTKKINKLLKNPNKINVKVYYDKNEKGSTKNKTFTYKGNKLN